MQMPMPMLKLEALATPSPLPRELANACGRDVECAEDGRQAGSRRMRGPASHHGSSHRPTASQGRTMFTAPTLVSVMAREMLRTHSPRLHRTTAAAPQAPQQPSQGTHIGVGDGAGDAARAAPRRDVARQRLREQVGEGAACEGRMAAPAGGPRRGVDAPPGRLPAPRRRSGQAGAVRGWPGGVAGPREPCPAPGSRKEGPEGPRGAQLLHAPAMFMAVPTAMETAMLVPPLQLALTKPCEGGRAARWAGGQAGGKGATWRLSRVAPAPASCRSAPAPAATRLGSSVSHAVLDLSPDEGGGEGAACACGRAACSRGRWGRGWRSVEGPARFREPDMHAGLSCAQPSTSLTLAGLAHAARTGGARAGGAPAALGARRVRPSPAARDSSWGVGRASAPRSSKPPRPSRRLGISLAATGRESPARVGARKKGVM